MQRRTTVFKFTDHFTTLRRDMPGVLNLYNDQEDAGLGEESQNTFLVECIKGRRELAGGQVEYLVKWSGWKDAANTWQAQQTLQTAKSEIELFHQRELKSSSSSSSDSDITNELHIEPYQWKEEESKNQVEEVSSKLDLEEQSHQEDPVIEQDLSHHFERTDAGCLPY